MKNLSLLFTVLSVLVGSVTSVSAATQTFLADDGRLFANPERGMYYHVGSTSEQDVIQPWMFNVMENSNMTLMLRLYYLEDFKNQPLSQTQLDIISNDFAQMRQAGVKTILRFAYSNDIGVSDAPLSVVLNHMDQLAPIIQANADVIATAQAGFIGAWGEWHSSTNNLTDPANARQITEKWLEILPPERTVQLRTPALKQMITQDISALTSGEAFTDTLKARIGHHNDCFLASETDFGTYTNPVADKAWLNLETQFLPMGGETCATSSRSGCDTARVEMQQLHFSYLNSGYHPDVLADWESDGFLDEVKQKLGYRFELVLAEYEPAATTGSQLPISLDLLNTGWASSYNPRDVVLTLQSLDGLTEYAFTLDEDPRTWLPGSTINVDAMLDLPTDIPDGNYRLLFSLPDPMAAINHRPEYAIQLANPGLWDAATGKHDLGITIAITTAIEGDLNGDGFVGLDDLDIILSAWNQTVTAGDTAAGDPSGDGFVGLDDLDVVLNNWNAGNPPGSSVPEPGAILIVGSLVSVLIQRRPSSACG